MSISFVASETVLNFDYKKKTIGTLLMNNFFLL